jgi:hypothetical protein
MAAGQIRIRARLYRLLKNPIALALKGRTFRCAVVKPFILVIPRGFSPEESAVSFRRDDFFSSLFSRAEKGYLLDWALAPVFSG